MTGLNLDQPFMTFVILQTSLHPFLCEHCNFRAPVSVYRPSSSVLSVKLSNLADMLCPRALCLGTPLHGECADTTKADWSDVLDWIERKLNGSSTDSFS